MERKKKKILIAEDDPNFTSILREKFSQEGFSVFVAQDGKEGLQIIEKEKPDLIISDILLPLLNGIDMVKQIKGDKENLVVIFLTNIKDPAYFDAVKKMKKADYLIKSDVCLDDIVKISKKRLNLE